MYINNNIYNKDVNLWKKSWHDKTAFFCVAFLIAALLGFIDFPNFMDSMNKFVYAGTLWLAVILVPYKKINLSVFSSFNKIMLYVLLLSGAISILISLFNDGSYLAKVGDKYLTLFGRPSTALYAVMPIVALITTVPRFRCYMYAMVRWLLLIGLITFPFSARSQIIFILPFLLPYIPSFSKKYRTIFIIMAILSLYVSVMQSLRGSSLQIMMMFLICFSWIFKFSKRKLLLGVVSILAIILYFFLPMFMPSATNENSIFERIDNSKINMYEKTDTRTFLYMELVNDIYHNDAFIFGKGSNSQYFSPYFLESDSGNGDFYYRIESEVPILTYLLRGGLFYIVPYMLLIIRCIMKGINSEDKFRRNMAFSLFIWFVIMFMSGMFGAGIVQFFIWAYIGLLSQSEPKIVSPQICSI